MSRGSRAAWRKLSLVVGGAILFLVGYFNGSRYAIEPLAALNSVILPKPVAITALDLPSETKKWRLVVVNPHTVRDCRDRTAALIRIHNRLAHRHDVLQQLELAWVSTARSPENYQAIANYSLTLDRVQRLLREFGVPV